MSIPVGKILIIIAEILKLIGQNIPLTSAIAKVSDEYGYDEYEVWDAWNNR